MPSKFQGSSGKIGGLAVKGMIRDTEQRMANGESVITGPESPEERAHLQQVKAANERNGQSNQ